MSPDSSDDVAKNITPSGTAELNMGFIDKTGFLDSQGQACPPGLDLCASLADLCMEGRPQDQN